MRYIYLFNLSLKVAINALKLLFNKFIIINNRDRKRV